MCVELQNELIASPALTPVEQFKAGLITEEQLVAMLSPTAATKQGKRDYCNLPGHDSRGAKIGSASSRMNANLLDGNGALRTPRLIAALADVTIERVRGHIQWLKARNRLFVD